MLGVVIMWSLFWQYIAKNFDEILSLCGIKHTPRKIAAEVDEKRRWMFVNTRTSLVHSIVSGVWCAIILLTNTELFHDLNSYDKRVKNMACCCFGYFIYDSIALIKHLGVIRAYDILIHHAIVFGNLYFLCYKEALIGGVCVGLAAELANITINIRMIMKMSGRNPGNSSSYRRFRWMNLVFYCGLRLLFHSRITMYLINTQYQVPYSTPFVLWMMNTLNLMIGIFSYRLIKTDFLGGWKNKKSAEVSYDVPISQAEKFID